MRTPGGQSTWKSGIERACFMQICTLHYCSTWPPTRTTPHRSRLKDFVVSCTTPGPALGLAPLGLAPLGTKQSHILYIVHSNSEGRQGPDKVTSFLTQVVQLTPCRTLNILMLLYLLLMAR